MSKLGREFEANRRTARFPLQFAPTFMPKLGREFEANRRTAYRVMSTSASLDKVTVISAIGERFYKHLAVLPSEAGTYGIFGTQVLPFYDGVAIETLLEFEQAVY